MTLGILGAAALFTAGYVIWLVTRSDVVELRIGAGRQGSEAHDLIEAVAHISKRHAPGLKITVVPTNGAQDGIRRIELGELDLVTVPADVVTRPNLTLVAALYPDLYQLIVKRDSDIRSVADLPGHRIALPPASSAQIRSFWTLIGQYDVSPEALSGLPMPIDQAMNAMVNGKIDAIFRARAAGNRQIGWLAERTHVRLLEIDQSRAMGLRRSTLRPAVIPKGTYAGDPPVPERDLKTVASRRMLLARDDVPAEAIRLLTAILFERQRDLLLLSPLAGLIEQPDLSRSTFLPVHPGTIAFFDREKPSFLEEKAEFFALLLSMAVVLGSALLWLKRRLTEGQKGRVDGYNLELVELCADAGKTTSLDELAPYKSRMVDMLGKVIEDLDYDRVDGEGFHYFAFTWDAVNSTLADHERGLRDRQSAHRQKSARRST